MAVEPDGPSARLKVGLRFADTSACSQRTSTALSWSRFCSLPEKEVLALHTSSPVLSELPLHCFQCAWMYVLLGVFVSVPVRPPRANTSFLQGPMGLNIMRLSADVSVITLLQLDGISLSWQLGSALLNERHRWQQQQQQGSAVSRSSSYSTKYGTSPLRCSALSYASHHRSAYVLQS